MVRKSILIEEKAPSNCDENKAPALDSTSLLLLRRAGTLKRDFMETFYEFHPRERLDRELDVTFILPNLKRFTMRSN